MARLQNLHKAALILGGVVAGLVLAEIGVRLYGTVTDRSTSDLERMLAKSQRAAPGSSARVDSLSGLVRPSASSELVYELKPGLDCTFMGRRLRTNSHGMRDREYPRSKPDGTVRLAGLGDSVMFGWSVSEERGFLKVMEGRLNETADNGLRFEAMNFAVPGYNTAMEVLTFSRKALEFEPDGVILHFNHNDFGLPEFMLAPRDFWELDRLWLTDLASEGWQEITGTRRPWIRRGDLEGLSEHDRRRVRDRYRQLVGGEAVRRALVQLEALTTPRSIPVFLVVLHADRRPWSDVVPTAEELGFHVVVVGPYHSQYLRDHGLEPTDEAWARTFWRSHVDPHPNPLSHSLYASAIVDRLATLGIRWRPSTAEAATSMDHNVLQHAVGHGTSG